MEGLKEFLSVSYGNGSGYGSGYGDGCGDGSGYGYGDGSGCGDGSGYGSGYGYGYGYGDGYGLVNYDGLKVNYIDKLPTVITKLKQGYAKGFIINKDLTTKPCFIAKRGDFFAHADTLKKAVADVERKHQNSLPVEERIANFKEAIKGMDKIPASLLYDWHTTLTGSCDFGKDEFMRNNSISLDDEFTLKEFVELTKDNYGGEIIRRLCTDFID